MNKRGIRFLMVWIFIAALACGRPTTQPGTFGPQIVIRYPFGALAFYAVDMGSRSPANGFYIAFLPRED